jgi:hypothetical protein
MAEQGFSGTQQVPNQDPNWWAWSKDARYQPKGNQAGEIIGKGIGNVLKEGTEAASAAVESTMRNDIYGVVDKERSAFTGALAQVAGQSSTDAGQPSTQSLIPQNKQPTPPDINNTLNKISNLQASKDGGKVNEMYYLQRLVPELQSVRDKYPGYRQQFDQDVSKITGGIPANELMHSYIQQINEQRENAKTEKNKFESRAWSAIEKGFPGADAMYANVKNGTLTEPAFAKWYAGNEAVKYRFEMARMAHQETEWKTADAKKDAVRRAEEIGDTITSQYQNTPYEAAGITDKKIGEHMDDMMSNPGKYDNLEETAESNARVLMSHKNIALQAVRAELNKPDANGVSVAQKIGPEEVKRILADKAAYWDGYIGYAGKPEDMVLAKATANATKSIEDQNYFNQITNSSTKDFLLAASAAKKAGGDMTAQMIQKYWEDRNMADDIRQVAQKGVLNVWGQPLKDQGKTTLVGTLVKQAYDAGVSSPGFYNNYLGQIRVLTDPKAKPELKANVAAAFFSQHPDTQELLNKFGDSNRVFNDLTKPSVSKAIKKLASEDNHIAEDYQNTTEGWFRSLFAKSADKVNQTMENLPNKVHFTWDDVNHQLGLTPESKKYLVDSGNVSIEAELNKLNKGLKNMSTMQKEFGGDTNAYMMNILSNEGIDPSKFDFTSEAGQRIKAALIAAKQKQAEGDKE